MQQLSPDVLRQADLLAAANPEAMVAVFQYSGAYLYASPSHLTLLGFDPSELVGSNLMDMVIPEDLEHVRLAYMDAILHRLSIEIGVRLRTKSGEPLSVRAMAEHVTDPVSNEPLLLGKSTPVDLVG